ncbi:MAG TPA: leucine-rich repeat domain-containing protein [Spirochaetales bacterium]|nr:leucine-rich repeat domain-containing protein [Spirochaetales bacterium]
MESIRRLYPIALAAVAAVALASCDAIDPTSYEQDGVEYGLDEAGWTLVSARAASGDVVVPEAVRGSPVVAVAENAFRESSVESVTLPSSVLRVGEYAFMDCGSLTTADLGPGVTELPTGAFYGCAALERVALSDALASVGENAFYACAGLAALDLGDRLETLASRAVNDCDALVRLELPASLATMGYAAVVSCDGLTDIVMLGPTPPAVVGSGDAVPAAVTACGSLARVSVPAAAVDAYKAAVGWSVNASLIVAIAD